MAAATCKEVGAAHPAPTGHSRFGASGADRWITCPGSVKAQEGMPEEKSWYAREGTAGHAVAASCLERDQDAADFVGDTIEGIEIDAEMAEAVQVYLDTVRRDKQNRGGKLIVERRFHLDWLDPEFYGTADCARLGSVDRVLSVYDLKLGRGKAVEVAGNRQLAYYALGVIGTLPKTTKIEAVELVLVQPRRSHRDGPVRRWSVHPEELLNYCQDLVEAAKLARSDNPPRVAGDHCGFCRAAGVCPTLRKLALDQVQTDFTEEQPMLGHNNPPPDPMAMSKEELSALLDTADVIEAWLRAVRAHAEALANRGEQIPGWKLVAKRATRKWREDVNVASALQLDFGLDEETIFVSKLKSPAQIEKLLPRLDRDGLSSLYSKESSGTKLARDTDPRDEAAPSVQTDFD